MEEAALDLQAYMARVGYSGPVAPTESVLCALHRAQVFAIPFENLDIHLGRPIRLDAASLWAKLVNGQRGGYCYELNGLFLLVLRRLGFAVTCLAGRNLMNMRRASTHPRLTSVSPSIIRLRQAGAIPLCE